MQCLIACRRPVSLADAPLAEAGLDGSLFDLDVMSTLEGATDRVTTDSMMIKGDNLIPVGL